MRVRPYLQLVRLPNVFTAAADGLAGWLLVGGSLGEPGGWGPLVMASACLYAGGIVLNDVFDLDVDRVERPARPLPSGRVSVRLAAVLGAGLLASGVVWALLSETRNGWAVAAVLAACVAGYDSGLKRSVLGPFVMGACRGLNLLLGMSGSADLGGRLGVLAAVSYALFVAGITWVSRSEVHTGRRGDLVVGAVFQNLGIVGLLAAAGEFGPRGSLGVRVGLVLLGVLLGLVDCRLSEALRQPEPAVIQRAIRSAILSLVWLHVGLLLAVRGPVDAASVALFWFPARFASRWIDST